MKLGERFEIKAQRWPWQDNGKWNDRTGMCRFGGGWHYKLGFQTGGITERGCCVIVDLLWGSLRFTYRSAKGLAEDRKLEAERAARKAAADARAMAGSSF